MPWITTETQLEHMLQGCQVNGWHIDLWWRDESKLLTYWQAQGWPMDAKAGCGAVPCGDGLVAWLTIYAPGLWGVWGLGPTVPGVAWRVDGQRIPDGFVTLWNARAHGAAPKTGPLIPGQRVASIEPDKVCRIGIVALVHPTGGAASVIVAPDGQPIDAMGRKWFAVRERDQAFDWYWSRGRTAWKSYLVMRGSLYQKQRGLTKAAPGSTPRPNPVPGIPHNPPVLQQALNAIAGGAPVSLADKVALLWRVHEAAMTAEKAYHPTYIACEETDPKHASVLAHQAQLEAATASTWDAWDAANQEWTREILG